jgi:hypothetical protein
MFVKNQLLERMRKEHTNRSLPFFTRSVKYGGMTDM